MGSRLEWTSKFIKVVHNAKPLGIGRENPPHLYDLRKFVELCEGLPDETSVLITKGQSNESGRNDMEFYVKIEEIQKKPE